MLGKGEPYPVVHVAREYGGNDAWCGVRAEDHLVVASMGIALTLIERGRAFCANCEREIKRSNAGV